MTYVQVPKIVEQAGTCKASHRVTTRLLVCVKVQVRLLRQGLFVRYYFPVAPKGGGRGYAIHVSARKLGA